MVVAALSCTIPAGAKVKRIVIDKAKSESRAYDGKSFGGAGQYEKIVGQAYGELDPKDRRNAIIQDIQLAPKNSRGMVEYVAMFTLTKPVEMGKASNIMVYDVVNRGEILIRGKRQRVHVPGKRVAGRNSAWTGSGWRGSRNPSGSDGKKFRRLAGHGAGSGSIQEYQRQHVTSNRL